ncbi:MAG: Uma2 family endonuclease [Acidobacteriaceae bacterium]|nr:Uma2 family endonuclease [Acidobacteriaceae bacterium]MBV8572988.1 Uma2 family endonuclease [Acidobacteriaceae bacterium]
MSALNLVSVEEYLHTTYRPDRDYVDGFVLERNLGQYEHARLQMLILAILFQREKDWQICVLPECRLKIRNRKYRIPDVMVLSEDAPRTPVIEQAPLLCIEVVSPDDRMPDLVMRAGDYFSLGVPETWILNPYTKQAFVYAEQGLSESKEAVLRRGRIELPVIDLFGQV